MLGEFPSLRAYQGSVIPRPTVAERAQEVLSARRCVSRNLAKNRTLRAVKYSAPPAADRSYQPGDKVLVWREEVVENGIGEWIGPYAVVSQGTDSNIVFV